MFQIPQLVDEGHILPPKVIIKDIDVADDSRFSYEKDSMIIS